MSVRSCPDERPEKRRRVVHIIEPDSEEDESATISLSNGKKIIISFKSGKFEKNKEDIKNLYDDFCTPQQSDPGSVRTNAKKEKKTDKQK